MIVVRRGSITETPQLLWSYESWVEHWNKRLDETDILVGARLWCRIVECQNVSFAKARNNRRWLIPCLLFFYFNLYNILIIISVKVPGLSLSSNKRGTIIIAWLPCFAIFFVIVNCFCMFSFSLGSNTHISNQVFLVHLYLLM